MRDGTFSGADNPEPSKQCTLSLSSSRRYRTALVKREAAGSQRGTQTRPSRRLKRYCLNTRGEEIDLFSGQVRLHHVDIEIPGGFPLRVERTYKLHYSYSQKRSLMRRRVHAYDSGIAIGNNTLGVVGVNSRISQQTKRS